MAYQRLTMSVPSSVMRADPIRAVGPARARHVSRGAAGHLPVTRHRQAALRIQFLDWVHQSD